MNFSRAIHFSKWCWDIFEYFFTQDEFRDIFDVGSKNMLKMLRNSSCVKKNSKKCQDTTRESELPG